MRKKGFAIILVLATLVLLAMLSLTYIKLALIDRNIARNYMDNKRAKLIAQSAVDYAIGRLNEIFTTDGSLSNTDWMHDASRVSFAAKNTDGTLATIKINSKDSTYTLSCGGTYGRNSDIVITKVQDLNSLINVNDGLTDKRVSGNLKRIITNLARHPNVIGPVAPDIGRDIIENRPATGFASLNEIKRVLDGKYPGSGYYDKIARFLTCYAWKDNNVANPVPLSSNALTEYSKYCDGYSDYSTNIKVYRFGRGKEVIGGSQISNTTWWLRFTPEFPSAYAAPWDREFYIFALDELHPQWIQITSRSPVNINLAQEEILYALIKDLKGHFVLERRQSTPFGGGVFTPYNMFGQTLYYDVSKLTQDTTGNLGYLYSTETFSDQDAINITREIIKCRNKQDEYPTKFFGGTFKTWRQFNAFCNYLSTKTIVYDTRSIFYEFGITNADCKANYPTANTYPSTIGKSIAIKAKADVLKANFNPNLQLDESNPDANIRTLVDKTDLIVNSTEFCFTSMGYFEVESKGLILKAQGSDDSLLATDNKIIADAVIKTGFKLFDVARHSTQKDFLSHINADTDIATFIGSSATNTNNSRTIEIRPEPSCDINFINLSKQNEWGGYIALPTLKGPDKVLPGKEKGKIIPGTLETIISHFTTDFKADYHIDSLNTNFTALNLSDPGETIQGPYAYGFKGTISKPPSILAKSFRGAGTFPKYTWPDLRIDGAYVERLSCIAYDFNKILRADSYYDSNVLKDRTVISYWIKPWFIPENAGKPRTYFSQTHCIFPSISSMVSWQIFGHWFLPENGSPVETVAPYYGWSSNEKKPYYYPTCMVFGYSSAPVGLSYEAADGSGAMSSVNHKGHLHSPKVNTFLQAQWMHVTLVCDMSPDNYALNVSNLYINGATPPDHIKLPGTGIGFPDAKMKYFLTLTSGGILSMSDAKIKIGDASSFKLQPTYQDTVRNWSPDSTIDEFYIYAADTDLDHQENINRAKSVYTSGGRYYKPVLDETYFTSNLLELNTTENLPDGSTVPTPSPSGSTISLANRLTTIMGLSFSWYAEDIDDNGRPVLRNYKDYYTTPYPAIYPKINIKLIVNGAEKDEKIDDAYSPINLALNSLDTLRYKVTIKLEKADGTWSSSDADNTVLLYSPVFDDITIYYMQGTQFLSYHFE